tara:strand:+ start:819 stop:4622 length:3804 start_codon:yes stop_codon:yes gene_type:complete
MAQPVDFVGLNTFLYEVCGWDVANQNISASADTYLSQEWKLEYTTGQQQRYLVTQNHFGTFQYGNGLYFPHAFFSRSVNNYRAPFQFASDVEFLNPYLLRRNGPYGYSSWRQLRVGQNPLTRKQNHNSIITILDIPSEINMELESGMSQRVLPRYGNIKLFRESPVSSRYHPLLWNVGNQVQINNETVIRRFSAVSSLGNATEWMANDELNNILALPIGDENENYSLIKSYYLNGQLEAIDSPIDAFEFLKYRETIYPRDTNIYRTEVRNRTHFDFSWNSVQADRQKDRAIEFSTELCGTSSRWPLDADVDWETRAVPTSLAQMRLQGMSLDGGNGILQNAYSQYKKYSGIVNLSAYTASCYYSRRHDIVATTSLRSPEGMHLHETGSDSLIPVYNIYQGQAKWQAGEMAGYFEGTSSTFISRPKQPFYNSYDYYAENVRTKGQGYTLIPEFRISEHVADYEVSTEINDNLDIFEITGAHSVGKKDSSQDSFYKTYSNTDFFKHFKLIKDDHKDFIKPSKIKLVCKAVKKFLPYDGFYPAQRTVQISQQFYDSYAGNFTLFDFVNGFGGGDFIKGGSWGSNQKAAAQAILQPLFGPGILFNSIKSGVACDYPMYTNTASLDAVSSTTVVPVEDYHCFRITDEEDLFNERIRFETLAYPATQLANKDLPYNECHPSASQGKYRCLWSGQGNNLYIKMINNFLAEVPKFFLQDQKVTQIESFPQGNPNFGKVGQAALSAGLYYGMRIKMKKSLNGPNASWETTGSLGNVRKFSSPQAFDRNSETTGSKTQETFTMYSRPTAFGPNVSYAAAAFPASLIELDSTKGYNWAYTPPYYHGDAWLDLYFKPNENKKYSVHEIISSLTASYSRYYNPRGGSAIALHTINGSAMQLSASIDFRATAEKKLVTNEDTRQVEEVFVDAVDQNNSRWIIQTKWECPMLNFNYLSGGASSNTFGTGGDYSIIASGTYGNEQAPRGMWHQYGRIPQDDSEGVFLEITDIPEPWPSIDHGITNPVLSLADLCGFDKTPRRLGECADRKIVKEAVVAVPFVEMESEKRFFRIPRAVIQSAQGVEAPIPLPKAGDSIVDMVRKMKDYVFPPSMDFLNSDDIEPFSMYIFEFKHELSKLDLSDMWQNLPPEIGETLDMAETSIEHELLSKELLDKDLADNIQWMVFKVKQKAETNYFSTQAGRGGTLASIVEGSTSGVTYNWPYDFFSLVELVRLDAEVDLAEVGEDSEPVSKTKKQSEKRPSTFERKSKKSTVKKKSKNRKGR